MARDVVAASVGQPAPPPASKGTNILHVRAFVERFGNGAWDKLLTTFEPDDEATLRSAVPVGWYPLELDIALLRRADELFGRGDLTLVHELGAFSALMDLNGIQRMFLKALTPAGILAKASDYWSRFHNTGRWAVQSAHPRATAASLRGWGVADEAGCAFLSGYIVAMFRASGGPAKRFQHDTCRCRGADVCIFAGEWAP
jgi:hypothetical protein